MQTEKSKNHHPDDSLTLLIFKDNFSSRSFKIPIRWIRRLSIMLAIMVLLTLISVTFTGQTYFNSERSRQLRKIEAIETELFSVKEDFSSLQAKYRLLTQSDEALEKAKTSPTLFTGLPSQVKPIDQTVRPNISLTDREMIWTNSGHVEVRFNIRYVKSDNGTQRGRIVILARGSGQLHSYPNEALNPPGFESLIDPQKGEYFSVSRFRSVKMRFGPFKNKDDISHVEILLFGTNFETLFIETLQMNDQDSRSKPSE